MSTTRQHRELVDALDHARRCAGRLESRARLNGDLSLRAYALGAKVRVIWARGRIGRFERTQRRLVV